MKLLLLILGLLSVSTPAPQGSHKTINHTFQLSKNHKTLKIDAHPDLIEVIPIKGTRVLIELSITLENSTLNVLDFLVSQDRYQLKAVSNYRQDELHLILPNKGENIFIKGEELIEEVHYKIFLPEQIIYLKSSTNQIKV